jgi:hypothetical protein
MAYKSGGIVNTAGGSFTGAGAVVTLTLGFVPATVEIFNSTDAIAWTKFYDMAATITKKVAAAGTQTADANSLIVINSDGTVTISATLAVNAKVFSWVARG